MLGIHPHGFAVGALMRHRLVPPEVAAGAHLALAADAVIDDDLSHGVAALRERLVDRALQLDRVAPAPTAVGGHDQLAPASSIRSLTALAEKPPNTTE